MLPETFRTARLFLRPIAMADAGPIYATYARNPEVTGGCGGPGARRRQPYRDLDRTGRSEPWQLPHLAGLSVDLDDVPGQEL